MQKVKMVLIVCSAMVVLALGGWVVYLELFIIPGMLTRQFGQASTLVHILGILFLLVAWGELRGWLKERHIFQTQEKLVSNHLNSLISAIDNLAVGKWAADSHTYSRLIDTGARMGFTLGKAASTELDRGAIVDGIGRMALPEGRQMAGQSTDVIGEMDSYLNDMDARKQRLSS